MWMKSGFMKLFKERHETVCWDFISFYNHYNVFSKQHNKHSTSLVIKQRCGFEYVGTESAATLALSTLWCVELYDFILCL